MKSLPRHFKLKIVASELTPNVNILDDLIGSTENDFLFIGEQLQDFHQRASHVAKMTTDAGGHLAGKEVGSIIDKLNAVLEMADNLHGGFASEKKTLELMINNLLQIRSPLAAFDKIVRNLNILCNFIKIEIARLGRSDTGFNTLADDIRRLASLTGIKTTDLTDKADFLTPLLGENLSLVDHLGSKNEDQTEMILQKIIQNIGLLHEKTKTSANSIKDVAQKWENISFNMAKVVESVQFHDITRQRFEHAREALHELPHKIFQIRKDRSGLQRLYRLFKTNSGNGNGSWKNGVEEADVIADTCELETAQLQNARDGFVDAVGRILDSLNNIAGHAGSMSTHIYEIAGGGNDMKESFIFELEQDVGYLDNCVNQCLQLNNDLSEAMMKVAETASGMSVFMKELEKISIEMSMLALNARVHAAHIGDQGATLGVLADSIHQLATQTAAQVAFISSNLKDVVAHAEQLAAKANQENLAVQDKARTIKDHFVQIIEPVKRIEDELRTLLPDIDQAGKILAEDIQQLTSQVTIHQHIDTRIKDVVQSLINISENVRPDKTADSSTDRDNHLDDLARRYTMHTERETHLRAASRKASATPLMTAGPIADAPKADLAVQGPAGDDLGDNVELF